MTTSSSTNKEKLIFAITGQNVMVHPLFFGGACAMAWVLFGPLVGIILIGISFFAIFLKIFENYTLFDELKEEYLKRVTQDWAKKGKSPQEVSNRFSLLESSSCLNSFYLNQVLHDPTYMNPFDMGSIAGTLSQVYTDPTFDLNNPFNANYGTGFSAIEQQTQISPAVTHTDFS